MEEALKKAAQWEVEKVAPTPRPRGVVAATPRGGHWRWPRRGDAGAPARARGDDHVRQRVAAGRRAHVDGQARGDDLCQSTSESGAARPMEGPEI